MASWADTNYTKRIQITVQEAYIGSDLVDFPCLVKLTDTQAIAIGDIASKRYDFYDHTGVRLAFEQETYSEGASYANFEDWVRIPNLYTAPAGEQNYIWLYYGYDYGADRDQPTSVWDVHFKGVWHLGEAASPAVDSTSNANHGTYVSLLPSAAIGMIGNGQSATGGYVTISPIQLAGDFTIQGWADFDGTICNNLDFLSYYAYDSNINWYARRVRLYWAGLDRIIADYSAPVFGWQHYAVRRTGTALKWVIGGAEDAGVGAAYSATVYGGALIALTSGKRDEIRISDSARSTFWLNFEYRNIYEADNELTWGGEELNGKLGLTCAGGSLILSI